MRFGVSFWEILLIGNPTPPFPLNRLILWNHGVSEKRLRKILSANGLGLKILQTKGFRAKDISKLGTPGGSGCSGAIWRITIGLVSAYDLAPIMSRVPSFDRWKELLRNDSIASDKEKAFDDLGECILKILYENGLEPTVRALVKDGLNGVPKPPVIPTRKSPNLRKKSTQSESL